MDVKASTKSSESEIARHVTKGNAAAAVESLDGQYFMVDVCANLANKKFSRDLDGVIERAKDSGIQKVMILPTSVQSSKDALRLTRLYPSYVYCTAGVHPHDAKMWSDDTLLTIREILTNPECVGVGQCGLDFSKTYSEPDVQVAVFEKLAALAAELNKPLVVYEREAIDKVVGVLSAFRDKLPGIVIHSFAGNSKQLEKYLSLGCYICLNGFVWKDKSEDGMKKILEECLIPLDRLLVETDSPFMYPNTRASQVSSDFKKELTEKSLSYLHRYCTFQRNEPCSLPVIIEMIAPYYNLRPEDVALKTTFSALKIFGLC